jgi:hypothetical protein
MSGFSDRNKQKAANPAQMFLEWSSMEKAFMYYDKEAEKNVVVPLPMTFLVMKDLNTVKGWDDISNSGIYSNEVDDLSKEKLHVGSFKGGTIAEGLYKDIKPVIVSAGAKFTKSLYVITKGGKFINIALKGGSFGAWVEFTKKSRNRLSDEWVTVRGFLTERNGGITYNIPVYEFAGSLTDAEFELATQADELLTTYMNAYKGQNETAEIEEHEAKADAPMDYEAAAKQKADEELAGMLTDDEAEAYEAEVVDTEDLPF